VNSIQIWGLATEELLRQDVKSNTQPYTRGTCQEPRRTPTGESTGAALDPQTTTKARRSAAAIYEKKIAGNQFQ
jgi:hypothetical protein